MLPAVPPTARFALLLPFFLYLCHAYRTTMSVATNRLVAQPLFILYYFSNRLLNILFSKVLVTENGLLILTALPYPPY